ncbi:NADPH-dependent 7-cyano-7-deazaguanine reductase QueF [Legionella yabuuchiae]|uniref:NADPH-dependent 7-cyano-7-deazaguanine reductase QueF n=1 Tax=Legionella yabuuchiae TaxID=376727 RepID=UPI001056D747|nr:NADPH-dependent 7-cyano-7-deazaguanine reductase QueF [Legionella yabuuchiae]
MFTDDHCKEANNSPLGKKITYVSEYNPELLFSIPRTGKRDEIRVPEPIPFFGFDTWNAYEVSWLNRKGKPQNAIVRFDINCHSVNIIESKSFKLYLNSFNNTRLDSLDELRALLTKDIQIAAGGEVLITIFALDDFLNQTIETFDGVCLDTLDIEVDSYQINPERMTTDKSQNVSEILYSHLLKSNCLVTGQPDWGSIQIKYSGAKIDHAQLLNYLISFRNHNEFHEQCVERIFMDIQTHCQPVELTVTARYTRRGGLDINPTRSSSPIGPEKNIRMARQ